MKSSTASLLFGSVLLLGLAGKLLTNASPAAADPDPFVDTAAALLDAHGFAVSRERRTYGTLVHGRRDGCRILIGDYTPYGTFADAFNEAAAGIGPLRFAYRGTVYPQPPKLLPLTEYYIQRELLRIGIPTRRTPIAAVAASANCDLAEFDWRNLGTVRP